MGSDSQQGRLQGQRDPPLNDLGRAQVEALAARLKGDQGSTAAVIFASDLQRAAVTAAAIANGGRDGLDNTGAGSPPEAVTTLPTFRERSLGVLEVSPTPHNTKRYGISICTFL